MTSHERRLIATTDHVTRLMDRVASCKVDPILLAQRGAIARDTGTVKTPS